MTYYYIDKELKLCADENGVTLRKKRMFLEPDFLFQIGDFTGQTARQVVKNWALEKGSTRQQMAAASKYIGEELVYEETEKFIASKFTESEHRFIKLVCEKKAVSMAEFAREAILKAAEKDAKKLNVSKGDDINR